MSGRSQSKPAGRRVRHPPAHESIRWILQRRETWKLAGLIDAKACRGGRLLVPSSPYASSQYALLGSSAQSGRRGVERLLERTEEDGLFHSLDGGVASLAAHDSAEV